MAKTDADAAGATTSTYIESAAGIVAGGRSGFTAVALFVAPLVGALAAAATGLVVVGSLMVATVAVIPWSDPVVALPAFLTMPAIPQTFSIGNGIAFGFISDTALKVIRGEFRSVNWLVSVPTALFIARFAYLSA